MNFYILKIVGPIIIDKFNKRYNKYKKYSNSNHILINVNHSRERE